MVISIWLFTGCSNKEKDTSVTEIIIENEEMRLVIGNDGTSRSLIHKSTGQECLMKGVKMPLFSITQDRPYDNEIMLAYPAKEKTFFSDSVYRDGNKLIISFELIDYVATVGLNITDSYIGFSLEKLNYHMADFGVNRKTPIFVRFNQKTSIQEEVAERLAVIVKEAGFKFIYYDGAEDVPPPYWFNVSNAQMVVHEVRGVSNST